MGRIEAEIALESWLFGFWPCSGQGQFNLFSALNYNTKCLGLPLLKGQLSHLKISFEFC